MATVQPETLGQHVMNVLTETYNNLEVIMGRPGHFDGIDELDEYKTSRALMTNMAQADIEHPLELLKKSRDEAVLEKLEPLLSQIADRMMNSVVYDVYDSHQKALLEDIVLGRKLLLTWPDKHSVVARCVDMYATAGILILKGVPDLSRVYCTPESGNPDLKSVYTVPDAEGKDSTLIVSQLKFLPERPAVS